MNGRGHDVFATSGFGVILMYGSLVLPTRHPGSSRQAFPGHQFPAHV